MQFDGAVTRTSKRSATWLLAGGLALAACSGGDDPVPSTLPLPTVAPTTAAPLVTDPTVPPTSPPTTQAPTTLAPTTAPVTTAPPVTAPPSTTAEELFAEATEVLPDLLINFVDVVNHAFRDPADPGLRDQLAALSFSTALDRLTATLDDYVSSGTFAGLNTDDPARIEPVLDSVFIVPENHAAGLDACVIDTDPQMLRNDDGSETVTDATPDSFLITYAFEKVDGRWLVSTFDLNQRFDDQIGCT